MKELTAKTLASEILTAAKTWGGLKGKTLRMELSTCEVISITIPAPEVEPKFTAGSRYHLPRQMPTRGQLKFIRGVAESIMIGTFPVTTRAAIRAEQSLTSAAL